MTLGYCRSCVVLIKQGREQLQATESEIPVVRENEYQCALCEELFTKTWDDQEAMAETVKIFGPVPQDQCEIVCDNCFRKVMPQPLG